MNKELCQRVKHSRPKGEDNNLTFPHKLYMMLELADSLGLSHIVTWLPDGRSFQIVDPHEFMRLVLPHFFKATKFRSFIRQLNLWDFERMPTLRDNHWYHKSFIHGRPEMLPSLVRTKIKGKSRRITRRITDCEETPEKQSPSLSDDCAKSVSPDTLPVGNASNSDMSSSDEEFDEIMKEIYSMNEIPCQAEEDMSFNSWSIVSDSNKNGNDAAGSRSVGKTWDSLLIEIEPLPMSSVDSLGPQNADLDDFQSLLCRLIH